MESREDAGFMEKTIRRSAETFLAPALAHIAEGFGNSGGWNVRTGFVV